MAIFGKCKIISEHDSEISALHSANAINEALFEAIKNALPTD